MLVVADSSPIIALVNTQHIEILPLLFSRVVIPPAVANELESGRRPDAVRRLAASPPAWLEQATPKTVETKASLHAGEAAAIALSLELRADALLIDEIRGRKAAKELNIAIIGTIGVMELAAERGLLDLAQAFEALSRTDFWVSPNLLDEQLRRFVARKATDRR